MIKRFKSSLKGDVHFSELFRGSVLAFIFRLVGIAAGYLFTILITQGYGAEAMGIFALSFTVLQIAAVFGQFGMDTVILKITGENSAKNNGASVIQNAYVKIVMIVLLLSLFISIGLYWSSPLIATAVFDTPTMILPLQWIALSVLPMAILAIHKEALRGLKEIISYSIFTTVSVPFIASIGLIVLLTVGNYSKEMPVVAQIGSIIISAIFAVLIWRKKYKRVVSDSNQFSKNEDFLTYTDIIKIAIPMMFASSLFLIMNWTDTLMLGIFRTQEEVGVYNVALKISMLTSITLMAINAIAAPKFSEMWGKKDINGLKKVVQQSSKMIFWSSLPILILFLLAPKFLLAFFGDEFTIGATVLVILTIGQFFNAISGSVGTLLSMTGHQVIVQNVLIVSIVINIFLNYILVAPLGMVGVGIATATSTVIWNLLMVYFVWKKLGFLSIKF